jgi:hypothetical protein
VACGGSSSNDSSTASNPTSSNSSNNNSDSSTQLQGFYQATALIGGVNKEFISLVVPTTGVNAKWYGWHFIHEDINNVGDEANLFTGTLTLGVNGVAQSSNNSILSFTNPVAWKTGTGTISITQGSFTKYLATLIYTPDTRAQVQISITATAAANSEYVFTQPATYTSLKGTWTGAWSSKGDSVGATLVFNNVDEVIGGVTKSPGMLISTATGWNCNVNSTTPLRLTSDIDGRNFFTVAVTLPPSICHWSNQGVDTALTGVGFVHISGTNSILDLMLLDSNGRGIISFRGVK